MKKFVITCSSTCDLSPYFLRNHNIYYVSFYYYLNGEKFYDNFYDKHEVNEFYHILKTSESKTSQPDPLQYKELWSKLICQGNDILHIELSSGISGAYNSALLARDMVLEEYNDSKIYVVDSLSASSGYGFLLDLVSKYKENNNDIDKVYEYAEKEKLNINHIFIMSNFDQLIKGGRISNLTGSIGKLMNIVPILHVNTEGKLEVVKKARGINNGIDEIINMIKSNIINGDKYNEVFFMNKSAESDNYNKLFNKIKENFIYSSLKEENVFNIGTVIGSHIGSGCFAVYYHGNGRA